MATSPDRSHIAGDIREHADQTSGRVKRRRVSQACTNCRRRKIKCKGLTRDKSCDSCISLRAECVLVPDGDRRRIGSREQVSALQERLRRLESTLVAFGHPPDQDIDIPSGFEPPPDISVLSNDSPIQQRTDLHCPGEDPRGIHSLAGSGFDESNITVREYVPFKSTSGSDATVLASGQDSACQTSTVVPSQAPDELSEIIVRSAPPRNLSQGSCQAREGSSHRSIETTSSAPLPVLTPVPAFQEISPTNPPSAPSDDADGHLALDELLGQTRFYGPTSQPYIQANGGRDQNNKDTRPDETDHTTLDPDTAPLVETLLDIFFRAQPLTVIVVNKEAFQNDRHNGYPTQRWSWFLQHAVLACATRMSTSDELRKLGTLYAARARLEITKELENPTMATLQGFLLLSDFEATRGRDRLGYLYCGIASTLVFDLGLTENCTALVKQGKMTIEDTEQRHSLLLATYVFDKLWSMYLGRPSGIHPTMVAKAHQRVTYSGWKCPDSLEQWVGLCTDMSQLTDLLLCSSLHDEGVVERLLAVDERIRRRHESLSSPLRLNTGSIAELIPSVYGLQIQFHGTRIVLHGLVHKVTQALDAPGGFDITTTTDRESRTRSSRNVMCESAITVARLVQTYQQIYGVQNMVTIMLDNVYVSAAVLVSYAVQWQPQGCSITDLHYEHWLQVLADLLRKAQWHYPVASRMLATLAGSASGTKLVGTFDNPGSQSFEDKGSNRDQNSATIALAAERMVSDTQRLSRAGTQPRLMMDEDDTTFQDLFGNFDGLNMFHGSAGNAMDWTFPSLCV